jgi:hypothetical protein
MYDDLRPMPADRDSLHSDACKSGASDQFQLELGLLALVSQQQSTQCLACYCTSVQPASPAVGATPLPRGRTA